MPIHNSDIARIFNQIADLLEISGANPFRVRAYRHAARTVEDQPQSVAAMIEKGEDLSEISGIGKVLAGKITEIVATGSLKMLTDLQQEVPEGLSELMKITQLGPKRVAALHKNLGIKDLEDLAEAARQGQIRDLEGFGEKTEDHILKELKRRKGAEKRAKLAEAEKEIESCCRVGGVVDKGY